MIYVGYLKVLCPSSCSVCYKHMTVDQAYYYLEGSTYFCSNMCMREWMGELFWDRHQKPTLQEQIENVRLSFREAAHKLFPLSKY